MFPAWKEWSFHQQGLEIDYGAPSSTRHSDARSVRSSRWNGLEPTGSAASTCDRHDHRMLRRINPVGETRLHDRQRRDHHRKLAILIHIGARESTRARLAQGTPEFDRLNRCWPSSNQPVRWLRAAWYALGRPWKARRSTRSGAYGAAAWPRSMPISKRCWRWRMAARTAHCGRRHFVGIARGRRISILDRQRLSSTPASVEKLRTIGGQVRKPIVRGETARSNGAFRREISLKEALGQVGRPPETARTCLMAGAGRLPEVLKVLMGRMAPGACPPRLEGAAEAAWDLPMRWAAASIGSGRDDPLRCEPHPELVRCAAASCGHAEMRSRRPSGTAISAAISARVQFLPGSRCSRDDAAEAGSRRRDPAVRVPAAAFHPRPDHERRDDIGEPGQDAAKPARSPRASRAIASSIGRISG